MLARVAAKSSTCRAQVRSSAKVTSARGRGYAESGIDMLKRDHKEVFEMLDVMKTRSGAEAKAIMNKVTEELSKHAAVEEQVLYPALRVLANEGGLADHARKEHSDVKVTLARLEKLMPDHPEWNGLVDHLCSSLKHHVQEEESKIFPIFTSKLERDSLENMGAVLSGLKSVAPLRPHPGSPDTQPGVSMVGMVAGFMDRIQKMMGMSPNAMPTDAKDADEVIRKAKSEPSAQKASERKF